jgi:ATP-dependent Clp protease ATP-binding subunit ClpA
MVDKSAWAESEALWESADSIIVVYLPEDDDLKNIVRYARMETSTPSQYRRVIVSHLVRKIKSDSTLYSYVYDLDSDETKQVYNIVCKFNPIAELEMVLSQEAPKKQIELVAYDIDATIGNVKKRIVGQDEAVDTICNSIRRHKAGLSPANKPVGSFLMAGQPGVGKTELAKTIARYFYGSSQHLIRVDCAEYALPHEYAKLIGSPPGYIGHNEGGYLTEAAKELNEFVVLFDEVEKAHSKMHNILLSLIDEGIVTDARGKQSSFRNALILMTTNLGTTGADAGSMHFGAEDSKVLKGSHVNRAIKKHFRPEFINRLDDICTFNCLTYDNLHQIAALQMAVLQERTYTQTGITLTIQANVAAMVVSMRSEEEKGGRDINRIIYKYIDIPLANIILEGNVRKGGEVLVQRMKRLRTSMDNMLEFVVVKEEDEERFDETQE